MTGPNQHYIPQKLLRGFAAGKKGKHTQVWAYRRNGDAFPTSTRGVGASRYFNSPPEDMTLDTAISEYEQGLDKVVDDLRALPDGASVHSAVAAELATHLVVRAAYLRELLSVTVGVAVERADSIFADTLKARAYLGVDGSDISEDLDKEIRKAVTFVKANAVPNIPAVATYRFFRMVLREHFDAFHESDIAPGLVGALATLGARATEIATKSHREMLLRNLIPPGWLDRLLPWRWSVRVVNEGSYVLPDCIAIARKKDVPDAYVALVMGDDEELDEIILPLASNRLLIGLRGATHTLSVDEFNRHAAASSQTFFVSGTPPEGLGNLPQLIGQRMADELRIALNDMGEGQPDAASVMDDISMPEVRWAVRANAESPEADVAVDLLRSLAQCVAAPDSLRRLKVTTFTQDYAGTIWAHEASCGRPVPSAGSQAAPPGAVIALADEGPEGSVTVVVARRELLDQIAGDDTAQRDVALHHLAHSWARSIYMDHWENAVHEASPIQWHAWIDLVTNPARTAMESYMASRLASRYVPGALPDHEPDAIQALAALRATIDEAKAQVRKDNDWEHFLQQLHFPMTHVAVAIGALLGDATERGSIGPSEQLRLTLEDLGLSRWWPIFAADLAIRFADRGTWSGRDALESLEAHIERIYVALGVIMEPAGDRVTFFLP